MSSQPPSFPPPAKRTRGEKRRIFFDALASGDRINEASRRAGISIATASRWANQVGKKVTDALPSKDELVGDLFKAYMRAGVAHKASIAKRIFEAMGFAMRVQADETQRSASAPLRDVVITWINEREKSRDRAHRQPAASAESLAPQHVQPIESDNKPYVNAPQSGADCELVPGGSPQASGVEGVRVNSPTATKNQDSAPDSEKEEK
jgi:transposase-like protein